MAAGNNEENDELKQCFLVVAGEIGCEWKWLARLLNIPDATIESIDVEYSTTEEKAYQILMKWLQANGRARATKEVLGKALTRRGKTSLAEKIGYFGMNYYSLSKITGELLVNLLIFAFVNHKTMNRMAFSKNTSINVYSNKSIRHLML